jgi:hypothetical protein
MAVDQPASVRQRVRRPGAARPVSSDGNGVQHGLLGVPIVTPIVASESQAKPNSIPAVLRLHIATIISALARVIPLIIGPIPAASASVMPHPLLLVALKNKFPSANASTSQNKNGSHVKGQ